MVKALRITEIMNTAQAFVWLNLGADFTSVKFSSAVLTSGIWVVKCSFKEAKSNLSQECVLHISNDTKEVLSFSKAADLKTGE